MTRTDSLLASHQLRPRLLGAAAALLVVMSACSGTTAVVEITTAAPATTTVAPPVSTNAPQPAELLAASIATYEAGYEFTSTTNVNDQHATTQTGRWIDGSSQILVESGDAQVELIITAEGQWSRLADGEWAELDATGDVAYPLEGMKDAESFEVVASEGTRTSVLATYSANAMGLSGAPVEVVLDFEDNLLVGFSYTAEVDGAAIDSSTTVSYPSDPTPITAPTT